MFASDLITVAAAGKTGLEYARDFVDERRGCPELDAFEQRFADVLKKAVKNSLPNEIAKDMFEKKHNQILRTLKDVDISDANDTPLRICEEITTHILNELEIDSIDRKELVEAVETAYHAAIDKFIDEMPEGDADRWLLEASKDTQKKLCSLNQELRELRTELSYRDDLMGRIEPFERIDPTTDDWVDQVSAELEVEAERELPFQEPAEFSAVVDEQFALVIGRAGLGKSRTLVEAIEQIGNRVTFDLAVVISGKIDDPADLDSLARTDVNGDVLLVWDDLHQVSGDQIISDSIGRLKNEFDRSGVNLHVRGAVRSEHLDAILPKNWGIEELRQPTDPHGRHPVWGMFEPVELESFNAEILDEFIRHALGYHELKADDDVIESFVERVLEADPTPFYVDTICRNTTGNEITQSDINQLPESALTSWNTAYNELPHDGQYGDPRDVLHTLSILDVLNVSPDELLVEDIFIEVFSGGREYPDQIDFLEDRGWITSQGIGSDTKFIVHDVRLEAIAANYTLDDHRHDVDALSDFLKGSLVDSYTGDLNAMLNANFALHMFLHRIGRRPVQIANQHFERAVELNEETPTVNRKYAEFLRTQNQIQEASKMYKQTIEQFPKDTKLRKCYIRFSEMMNWYEETRKQYEQAINIEPDNAGIRTDYARYLVKQGEHEEARKQYEQAINIDPGNNWLHKSYTEFLIEQGESEEANKQYEQAINIEPDDTGLRTDYASYLAKHGEIKKAHKQYEQAIDIEPDNPELRICYAYYLIRQNEHEEARKQYKQAIDIEPGDTGLRTDYASYLAKQDEHQEARKQYERSIEIELGDTGLRTKYARYLIRQNEHEKFRKQYERAIDIEPGDIGLRTEYAMQLSIHSEPKEALKQYEQAIEVEPGDARLRRKYANFLIGQGEPEKALNQYEQAIHIDPGDMELRTEYAECLAKRCEHEEAHKQYKQAIEIEPGNTWNRAEYSRYLAKQEEYEEARKQYEQAIEIEPGNVRLRTEYAQYLAKQDEYEESRKQYEQAIEFKPGDMRLRTEYAQYLARQDEYDEARKQYEQAIDIKPGDIFLHKKYAEYFIELNESEEVLKQYEQAIEIEPGDKMLRTEYVWYLKKQGEHEEARRQYNQAIEIEPGDRRLRIEYVDYLIEQGEHEEAHKQYKQAIEIEPGDTWLRTRYASHLAKQNKHKEARKQYERAIEDGHEDVMTECPVPWCEEVLVFGQLPNHFLNMHN